MSPETHVPPRATVVSLSFCLTAMDSRQLFEGAPQSVYCKICTVGALKREAAEKADHIGAANMHGFCDGASFYEARQRTRARNGRSAPVCNEAYPIDSVEIEPNEHFDGVSAYPAHDGVRIGVLKFASVPGIEEMVDHSLGIRLSCVRKDKFLKFIKDFILSHYMRFYLYESWFFGHASLPAPRVSVTSMASRPQFAILYMWPRNSQVRLRLSLLFIVGPASVPVLD